MKKQINSHHMQQNNIKTKFSLKQIKLEKKTVKLIMKRRIKQLQLKLKGVSNWYHTVPILWRLFSRMIEIKMKTVQTPATAHVGVWSRSLELLLLSLEAIATPPLYNNHDNETKQKSDNLFLYIDINIGETKKHKLPNCVL